MKIKKENYYDELPEYIKKDSTAKTFDRIQKNTVKGIEGYRATFYYKNLNGTWNKETERTLTRPKAKGWITKKQDEYKDKGVSIEYAKDSFKSYAEDVYIPDFVEDLDSAKDEKRYVNVAVSFFESLEKGYKIQAVQTIQLRKYKKYLQKTPFRFEKSEDEKLIPIYRSARTINAYLERLRALFKQAEDDKVIPISPSFRKLIDKSLEEPRKLTIKGVEHLRLLSICDQVINGNDRMHIKPILIGLHELGCRRGELHKIQRKHISENFVTITSASKGKKGNNAKTKFRQMPISSELRKFFDETGVWDLPQDTFVFGKHQDIKNAWNTAKRLANVNMDYNLNDYRHTAITNAYQSGVKAKDRKDWFGHVEDSTMQDDVYINPDDLHGLEEMRKRDEFVAMRLQQAQQAEIQQASEANN